MNRAGTLGCGVGAALLVTMAVAGVAHADSVIVFALEPATPESTQAAEALRGHAVAVGHSAQLSSVPIEDAAIAAGCDPATPACLSQLATVLAVDEVVAFYPDAAGYRVVRARTDGAHETAVLVPDVDGASATATATSWYGAVPSAVPVEPDPVEPDPVAPAPVKGGGMSRPLRRGLQFGAMGVGGAMVIGGVAMWAKASSQQGDIDAHPVATRDDIDGLIALEDAAASDASWGNRLFVLGAVVAGAGVTWWLLDQDETGPQVAPIVGPDGVGATVRWGWQ